MPSGRSPHPGGWSPAPRHLPGASYLDHYLPRDDCQYDQPWALGALLHIDELQGANHASRFLQPDGLWQHWAKGRFDAAVQKKRIDELSSYVDKGPDLA
ncbi:DUF6000 family protein [Streptomyces hygroscopicus]|uniref:DUF6000 family protein n=1 Tax=Streptomyces hygroscopicus TaxID=1912 RepID=UPI0037BC34E2